MPRWKMTGSVGEKRRTIGRGTHASMMREVVVRTESNFKHLKKHM